MCWVYVLQDVRGRHYVGISDLARRIAEHNAGRTRGDRGRGPFTLIYKEQHVDRRSARLREKYLKSGAGREWLKGKLGAPAAPSQWTGPGRQL